MVTKEPCGVDFCSHLLCCQDLLRVCSHRSHGHAVPGPAQPGHPCWGLSRHGPGSALQPTHLAVWMSVPSSLSFPEATSNSWGHSYAPSHYTNCFLPPTMSRAFCHLVAEASQRHITSSSWPQLSLLLGVSPEQEPLKELGTPGPSASRSLVIPPCALASWLSWLSFMQPLENTSRMWCCSLKFTDYTRWLSSHLSWGPIDSGSWDVINAIFCVLSFSILLCYSKPFLNIRFRVMKFTHNSV